MGEENPRDGTGGVHVIAPSPAPRSESAGDRRRATATGERQCADGTATVQPLDRRRPAIYFAFTFSSAPSLVIRLVEKGSDGARIKIYI